MFIIETLIVIAGMGVTTYSVRNGIKSLRSHRQ